MTGLYKQQRDTTRSSCMMIMMIIRRYLFVILVFGYHHHYNFNRYNNPYGYSNTYTMIEATLIHHHTSSSHRCSSISRNRSRNVVVSYLPPSIMDTVVSTTTFQQHGMFGCRSPNNRNKIKILSKQSNDDDDETIHTSTASSSTTTISNLNTITTTKSSSSSLIQSQSNHNDGITNDQRDFIIGYMNKHHAELGIALVSYFSTIGTEMAQANVWSGGSYTIVSAILIDISMIPQQQQSISYNVTIQKRYQPTVEYRMISIPFNSNPIPERLRTCDTNFISPIPLSNHVVKSPTPIDIFIRHICRFCWIVRESHRTGQFIQLGIQLNTKNNHTCCIGQIPENMYLNQVPHNRYVRQWFYDQASIAIHDAVILCSHHTISNRMKVITLFPETNPSMDSYRIGTLLELLRTVAIRLVKYENLRIRICVQESMGVGIFTGIPKQLSGVARLLQSMDWQSNTGEMNDGILGNYIRFGGIGSQHVLNTVRDTYNDTIITQYQDDVFLIIAPQSMVGTDTSIIPSLVDMVQAAGDRPVILFNPDLTDKISSGGQQSIRGRQERINFANSFDTIFHFQNIYVSGTSYFPILGCITKLHPEQPWIAHQRRDYMNNDGEIYIPVLAGETIPDGEMILSAFEK